MRIALALLIACGSVSAQFDVGSNAAELLEQAEDALNDFLEENGISENDIEDLFDEYNNDDGDENYDEDYEEDDNGEFEENYEDNYADWYNEWEGWGENDWQDYWYQLVDAVYEFVDWATYEFGLDDEDWNSLFDYYYDGYFGF